jgi:hypothetical protein
MDEYEKILDSLAIIDENDKESVININKCLLCKK